MARGHGSSALDRLRLEVAALSPGDLLPSERALARQLGVARMTVRGAIDVLEREGVVRTRPGIGTELLPPAVSLQVGLRSFATAVREHGMEPSTRVLSLTHDTVRPPAASRHLRLPDDEPALHIRRLRLGDDRPLALEEVWFPVAVLPDVDERAVRGSLYDLLAERGLRPSEGVERVTAALPDADEVELLGIGPSSPVLRLTRTAGASGAPVEYAMVTFPADQYELEFPLPAQAPAAGA